MCVAIGHYAVQFDTHGLCRSEYGAVDVCRSEYGALMCAVVNMVRLMCAGQ